MSKVKIKSIVSKECVMFLIINLFEVSLAISFIECRLDRSKRQLTIFPPCLIFKFVDHKISRLTIFYLFSDIRRPLKRLFVVRHQLSSNWIHEFTFFVYMSIRLSLCFSFLFAHLLFFLCLSFFCVCVLIDKKQTKKIRVL